MLKVDGATGGVAIARYTIAYAIGRAINPMLIEGQLVGGLAQGIGGSLDRRADAVFLDVGVDHFLSTTQVCDDLIGMRLGRKGLEKIPVTFKHVPDHGESSLN